MDRHAVGLFLADAGFIIPPGGAPDFVPTLRRICREEKVEVVVPLVDEELTAVWELADDGVHIMLPRREFITLCLDKYALAQRLDGCDIRAPRTRLASEGVDAAMRFPLVVKPRTGRGSRGVELLESKEALRSYLGVSPYGEDELILQEYISGPEFTVSVVAWRDGEVQAVVPKEVISKRGITRLAVTRRNDGIDRLCRDIQSRLRADGPFNVQLRIDESSGEPVPFEINPRFSTTVSLTIAAGVDEVGVLIRQAVSGSNSSHFAQWSEGVVLIRQTLDEFVAESEFQTRNDHICGVKGQ
jgi:carbamoyl-phosphate synthase large subunit